MNTPGAKAYRPWTPELYAHQAHAPSAKLPEDDLVFFLIDVVPKLDLSKIHAPYQDETRGAPPFDPAMMVCLLLYSYCVGVFSSRKVARACERNLAFLAIVGEERPDFRTISLFRKNHLDAFADVFVQVLCLAKAAGLVRLGTIAIDGTKVQGNASRHKAMSYGYMTQEVARLRAEINELLKQARDVDAEEDAVLGARRGDELPEELRRRQDRLATIEAAMKRLEAEARAAADAERQRREEAEAQRQRTGTKRRGRAPGPIVDTPAVACCKVGLDRPLIPTAFVANLLRSPRVARPTVRPTGGLQVRRRRSGTGRPAVAEDGRVRRPLPEPAFEVPGSGRAWLGGPTDARENLKKLRRQLGLRNN